MAEDEVVEDEMIDLGDEVDFGDDDDTTDLGNDDLLVEDPVDMETDTHEIG